MQSILQGIEAIKEGNKRSSSGDSKFLKLTDGESATIRFLQELDSSGTNYSEDRGLAVGIYEHINPKDFSQSFLCTKEATGKCLGCEKQPIDKKWRPRGRLLVNVLLRGGRGEDNKVKILATSITNKGLTPQLVEFAEEYKTLCDRDYKMKRTGEGFDTVYTLMPRDIAPLKKEEELMELVRFDTVYKDLNHDQQLELLDSSSNSEKDW